MIYGAKGTATSCILFLSVSLVYYTTTVGVGLPHVLEPARVIILSGHSYFTDDLVVQSSVEAHVGGRDHSVA